MKTERKARGILYSAPMVRAKLEGTKTQTRRILKIPAWADPSDKGEDLEGDDPCMCSRDSGCLASVRCPYGQPGDLLYGKETWKPFIRVAQYTSGIHYAADGAQIDNEQAGSLWTIEKASKWRPSIFMPRWAARIWDEIVEVRVERLNDISEEDAKAEGFHSANDFLNYFAILNFTHASKRPNSDRWNSALEMPEMHTLASWRKALQVQENKERTNLSLPKVPHRGEYPNPKYGVSSRSESSLHATSENAQPREVSRGLAEEESAMSDQKGGALSTESCREFGSHHSPENLLWMPSGEKDKCAPSGLLSAAKCGMAVPLMSREEAQKALATFAWVVVTKPFKNENLR